MINKEYRYYFPEWGVLCTKSSKTYDVINGGWSFIYCEDTKQRRFEHTKKLVNDSKDTPIRVTYEEFIDIEPNFGYW